MTAVIGLPNGALKLVSLQPPKILATSKAITKTPSTVNFIEFDPSIPESYRYSTGSVVMALSHSPVLYKISIDPYTIEKFPLPSKHPIVMMKLNVSQSNLMYSSHIEINYKSIGQQALLVLQGDGTLTKILNNKIEWSIKLKKWDLRTEELIEPLLIDEESSESSEEDDDKFDDIKDINIDDIIEDVVDIDTNKQDEGDDKTKKDQEQDAINEEIKKDGEEEKIESGNMIEQQDENNDDNLKKENKEEELPQVIKKKKYIIPTEIKGLYGIFGLGDGFVIGSNKNALPIRRYTFSNEVQCSPPCDLKHISICVIDEEIFLGCSNGMIQRYSFESRKRAVLSHYKKVYKPDDLAHPIERMDKREEVHPMITVQLSSFPIISICSIPNSRLIACGTSAGRVYLFNTLTNTVVCCLKGPQGSVRLSSVHNYLVGISLDRWMYVWDPIKKIPISKTYLHGLPNALVLH
ncbi:hypothetical protein EDI_319910 [Entamoeba dispar SAW760]|uniref:Uncharacterized protein n=1 Tax=Entamoeba dispar (strain ATCC PRA-260 / SAW760) TaxID=370354 RepID=B0E794_ENTDS|nr:uncharacterized protein EDI_319910 [Entamoeba dispar SAW760]EDR29604.1 hypothetical protein EDI_319910 [Entamoeba dispar SAW760]|eukprot:EDR29604.1 hypothetical protein EDI_319910 [Entamoeba dispar SAW760]